MKIRNPKTHEAMTTHCKGCMCHDLPMQFGQDKDVCEECGCPKTEAGWERVKATGVTIVKEAGDER